MVMGHRDSPVLLFFSLGINLFNLVVHVVHRPKFHAHSYGHTCTVPHVHTNTLAYLVKVREKGQKQSEMI